MDKISYLKLCFQALSPMEEKSWYINMFGIPIGKEVTDFSSYKHLDLVCLMTGMVVVLDDESGRTTVPLTDYQKNKPLFSMEDMISVDGTWISTIKSPTEKRLGGLIINRVVVYPSVQEKFPYMDVPITEKKLESAFAEKMIQRNESKDPSKEIFVSDYVDCMDRLWFFTGIANLVTMASSYKTITPTPGARELADKLIAENKDKLNDPVVVTGIMNQLTALHDKELEGDPVAARMMDRKALTARKKLHLMYGETNDFVTSLQSKPVLSTMDQGVDTSDEVFPKYMNDLRYASYSRGHSTQLSGYGYKVIQRSLAGVEVSDTPCDTKRGLFRFIDKPNKLVGRYVFEKNDWKLVENLSDAGAYLGKFVSVRSPAYCQLNSDNDACYKCFGEMYKGVKNAVNNIGADFSGELMTLFLKRMHTSGFNITKIDEVDLFT